MTFLATDSPPTPTAEPAIENGWFPPINPANFREACRVDNTVTPARLRTALVVAMASVNQELDDFRHLHQAAGRESLANVPAAETGGTSVKVVQYVRAVYSTALADLAEQYREISTTAFQDGVGYTGKHEDKIELKAADQRRNARWAISDILGIRRTTVELI